jgi:hypothetical protein
MISSTKQSSIRLALDRTEAGIVESVDMLCSLLQEALGTQELPDGYRTVLKEMKTPSQKSSTPMLDHLITLMTASKLHDSALAQSLQEATDVWLDFSHAYLRLSGLAYRHSVYHFDVAVRRNRLASLLRRIRNSTDSLVQLRALSTYRKFRYCRVIEAIPEQGTSELLMDPTVNLNYTSHGRVGRPMLAILSYSDAVIMDPISKGHAKDFIQFKRRLRDKTLSAKETFIKSWLSARDLDKAPSLFMFNNQLRNLDAFSSLHDSGGMALRNQLSSGHFPDSDIIHPLATFWKVPLGKREKRAWHLWWKFEA